MNQKRYEYGIKNMYARQRFRGKLFYEKVCYNCGEHFLCVKQDTLACQRGSCQVSVSRRITKLKPLRPVEGVGKFPLKKIDFVKWGMEKGEKEEEVV